MKNDETLQRDVLEELQWEPSVEAAEIGVMARAGVVTLTGCVPTYIEKVTAERVAKRVHGVTAVANDIEVHPKGTGERTDTDIAQAAVSALRCKTTVPADRIKVSVSKGWITLDGDVDWHYQKEGAEDCVRYLLGVRGVMNLIGIRPKASATEVKSRIEAAFRRNAEVEAKGIRVETHDGKVTLHGDVQSWVERQEAERTAWSAPGVTHVDNLLAILP